MSSSSLITFLVDDHKFVLSKETFNDHPHSLLTHVIKYDTIDKHIVLDKDHDNIFHVSRNPKSFKYIVDHLRGYDIDINSIKNINLRNMVLHDLKYFNLDYNVINLDVPSEQDDESNSIENILKPSNEDYDEKDTPLLNRFHEFVNIDASQEQSIQPTQQPFPSFVDLVNQLTKNFNGEVTADFMNTLSNNDQIKDLIKKSQQESTISDSETASMDVDSNDTE